MSLATADRRLEDWVGPVHCNPSTASSSLHDTRTQSQPQHIHRITLLLLTNACTLEARSALSVVAHRS